ncbi:MAG: transaldolase, partial [Acidobacteria bacterium]
MLNSFEYFLPLDIENEVMREIRTWRSQDKVNRLWKKDATLWTGSDEARWLGWLDVAERELANLSKYEQFSSRAKVFESIVLLGMGGSSLCPEVLAKTFQRRKFFVLDSTVPAQIYSLEK